MKTFEELQTEIWDLEAAIALHATQLRTALEDLQGTLRNLEDEYVTPDGTHLTDYEIGDLAANVEEVENMFDTEGE